MTNYALSERTELLLRRALKSQGLNDVDNTYAYIVEDLYVDDAQDVYDFLVWLKDNEKPFGRDNAQIRWREFKVDKANGRIRKIVR